MEIRTEGCGPDACGGAAEKSSTAFVHVHVVKRAPACLQAQKTSDSKIFERVCGRAS
jgi:hypothetical protein